MNEQEKARVEKTKMQNVVQEMLPDDLKKQFVLQKNTAGGLEKMAQKPPITFDPSGNVSAPAAGVPKLDPNLVQKAIRTYESDLAEALAQKQGSVASISIAEKKRQDDQSRAAENVPQDQPFAQRPIVKPIAPTSATAIPGATISIPPSRVRDINSEIKDALRASAPARQTPPVVTAAVQPDPNFIPAAQPPKISVPPRTVVITNSEPQVSHLKPFLLTLVSITLICAGIFEGYILFKKTAVTKPAESPAPIVIPSIVPHDQQFVVTVGNETGNQLVTKIYSEINKHSVEQGKSIEFIIAQNRQRVGGTEIIKDLDTQIPDVIYRSLTDRWMLGVYGEENNEKTTYMALSTDFFQNAFAGMLNWEDSDMADDLALILNFKEKARQGAQNASSTASAYFTIKGKYSDKIIKNRDVREFRNDKGQLLFLYSFINKETLLLTTTESAFIALIERIEKDAYVR